MKEENGEKLKLLTQDKTDVIKIVLFGPESCGKTTLARQLARYYHTVWVEEYARPYLQDKWNFHRKTCVQDDLLPIAIGQIALENKLAKVANKVLVCDTDVLETIVYSTTYYEGYIDPILETAAKNNVYDLYLLCNIDIPWESDDLRDRPTRRQEMFDAFEQALMDNNRPYILIEGDRTNRLETATAAIDKLLIQSDEEHSLKTTV